MVHISQHISHYIRVTVRFNIGIIQCPLHTAPLFVLHPCNHSALYATVSRESCMKGHSSQFINRAIPLFSKLGNRGVAMFTFAMVMAAMLESKIY